MTKAFTKQELFNYSLISAELFPMLCAVQEDSQFFNSREQDVLHHLLRDKSIQEISHLIGLASHTVKYHIDSIKAKMKLTQKSTFVTQLMNQFDKLFLEIA